LPGFPDVCESFVPWGVPNPDSVPAEGVYCLGAVYLAPLVVDKILIKVWSSADLGATWSFETQSFSHIVRLACGIRQDLWVMFDSSIVHFDPVSGGWAGVFVLDDIEGQSLYSQTSIAADGRRLYIVGRTGSGDSFLRRFVDTDAADFGLFEELPLPTTSDSGLPLIKVDSQGILWMSRAQLFRFDEKQGHWTEAWPEHTVGVK
jgi:hypothetical protein